MSFEDRIEINPKVCNGKPVIKGTRIPITVILEQMSEGETLQDLLAGYPELTIDDVKAALRYARSFLDHSELKPINA